LILLQIGFTFYFTINIIVYILNCRYVMLGSLMLMDNVLGLVYVSLLEGRWIVRWYRIMTLAQTCWLVLRSRCLSLCTRMSLNAFGANLKRVYLFKTNFFVFDYPLIKNNISDFLLFIRYQSLRFYERITAISFIFIHWSCSNQLRYCITWSLPLNLSYLLFLDNIIVRLGYFHYFTKLFLWAFNLFEDGRGPN
jgi:hypothetical protein